MTSNWRGLIFSLIISLFHLGHFAALPTIGTLSTMTTPAVADEIAAPALTQVPFRLWEVANKNALSLIRDCPPEKCILVSLGTTNTLINTMLRHYIQRFKLPKHYLHYAPYRNLSNIARHVPESVQSYWLNQIFPSPQLTEGKTIVFMRVLHSGWTMESIAPALISHLKKHHPNSKMGLHFFKEDSFITQELYSSIIKLHDLGYIREVIDPEYCLTFAYRRAVSDNPYEKSSPSYFASSFELYDFYFPENISTQNLPSARNTPPLSISPNREEIDSLTKLFVETPYQFNRLLRRQSPGLHGLLDDPSCEHLFNYR